MGVGHVRMDCVTICYTGPKGEQFDAARNISLDVYPGEFVTLLGPSGCGKSSIINAVAGFVSPDSGTIALDGATVQGPSAQRTAVFQQESLFPWMTVTRNVEFGLKTQGVSLAERKTIVTSLLISAGLGSFGHFYPKQLSGGMKQRAALVRALATTPRVLLMDEPFGALDAQTRASMQELLMSIWERYRTSVLFVTHDIDEAILLSDRIYVMTARPGEIRSTLDVHLSRPRLPDVVESSEFHAIKRKLLLQVREESAKSLTLVSA
jgi:NitT/TauT family transport system ATP-binding protein